jgi:hypothetical protein
MAIPILWRTKKERYSLQSQVCPYCGREADTQKVETKQYDYSFLLPQTAELIGAGDD